jgi:hypothetical protein
MRKLILGTCFMLSFSAFATQNKSNLVCKVKAGHDFQAANLEIGYSKAMSEEECIAKGKELFNTKAQVGWRKINPLNDTVTETDIETEYRKVKITYYHADGEVSRHTLKRDHIRTVHKGKKVTKIQSGYRCWTKGECE